MTPPAQPPAPSPERWPSAESINKIFSDNFAPIVSGRSSEEDTLRAQLASTQAKLDASEKIDRHRRSTLGGLNQQNLTLAAALKQAREALGQSNSLLQQFDERWCDGTDVYDYLHQVRDLSRAQLKDNFAALSTHPDSIEQAEPNQSAKEQLLSADLEQNRLRSFLEMIEAKCKEKIRPGQYPNIVAEILRDCQRALSTHPDSALVGWQLIETPRSEEVEEALQFADSHDSTRGERTHECLAIFAKAVRNIASHPDSTMMRRVVEVLGSGQEIVFEGNPHRAIPSDDVDRLLADLGVKR